MRSLRAAACGLIAAGMLSACGSATSGMGFTVPAGYQSKFNLFGQEMWLRGDDTNAEVMMLINMPKPFDPSDVDQHFTFGSSSNEALKDTKVTSRKQISICGSQAAVLVTATGTSSKAASKNAKAATKAEEMEMLVTGWGKHTYMAMYMHGSDMKADPASEAALKTLCPKTS